MNEANLSVDDIFNLATQYHKNGGYENAEVLYKKILEVLPKHQQSLCHLGLLAKQQRKYRVAVQYFYKAIEADKSYMEGYHNLGELLKEIGQYQKSVDFYLKAIQINPKSAATYNSLAVVFKKLGQYQKSIESYLAAIDIDPNHEQAHYNLGILLSEVNRPEKALDYYYKAIKINPDNVHSYQNLNVLMRESLFNMKEIDQVKIEELLLFLFKGNNIDHTSVFPFVKSVLFSEITKIIWGKNVLLENNTIQSFLNNELIHLILQKSLICDLAVESLLMIIRKEFLLEASNKKWDLVEKNSNFIFSLAEQCFLNEYVYYQTEQEINLVNKLRARLENNSNINELGLAILGCYIPLSSSEIITDQLLNYQSKNSLFKEIITTQFHEPLEENRLKKLIKPLGKITNTISKRVKVQYEVNPYPRWKHSSKGVSINFWDLLSKEIEPNKTTIENFSSTNIQVLVAGCGTGKHIVRAKDYRNSEVTGIDLSLNSLAYAKRKTDKLGYKNIQYVQADILNLDKLDKTFDVIECAGVLHHMETPTEGLEILVNLLRPNGFMKIGLYSEIARKNLLGVRNFAKQEGFNSTVESIRMFRKSISDSNLKNRISNSSDFYSVSSVRDLIFHEQEHRFTLSQIMEILNKFGLEFLGFTLSKKIKMMYSERFPEDHKQVSLKNWHQFEKENPTTFAGMYTFWLRKKAK